MTPNPATRPPPAARTKPRAICFSFAAYAKTLIEHLRSLDVPILPGLTEDEFTSIEAKFHFQFPSDLRLLLREGVPVGPEFPDWCSSSTQQLQILLDLPLNKLFDDISWNGFWVNSWGSRPVDCEQALRTVKVIAGENVDGAFDNVPVLIPLIRNCYIPASSPNVAGNPVFLVEENGIRIISFDIARFFNDQVHHFLLHTTTKRKNCLELPVWAANEARRVDFWTEVVESGRWMNSTLHDGCRWWWNEEVELNGTQKYLEWVRRKLKSGGWNEEEVSEIVVNNPAEELDRTTTNVDMLLQTMSLVLLRAGWSMEDVVYSLGDFDDDIDDSDDDDCGKKRLFWSFKPNCVGEPPAKYDLDFFTFQVSWDHKIP